MATTEIVGREDELARIDAFLAEKGPRALLLEGEAGIGKTTLWRAAVQAAEARGCLVLASRPSGAETQISFAALRDLLDPLYDDIAQALPSPQRRALAVALLREDPVGDPPPEGAVAAGVVAALRGLAASRPLVLAVDDVQWLDPQSSALLEFAARRVGDAPITFVVARRDSGRAGTPLGLDRAFEDRLDVVAVGPLSLGALHRLLRDRLEVTLPRPQLRRVHDTSGGNAFFALELGRALQLHGADRRTDRLPLPENVHEALGQRLATLPEETRGALLFVSASAQPTLGVLTRALGDDLPERLEPALASGVVLTAGETVRFSHPLVAEVVYESAGASSRREAHARLASLSPDPEERARHRALSTTSPDRETAALLTDAAHQARARGASAVAAELLEHAIRLTPDEDVDDWAARRIDAADAYLAAGDRRDIDTLLAPVIARVAPGPMRADALLLLAEGTWDGFGFEQTRRQIEEALRDAGGDRLRSARALLELAMIQFNVGEVAPALDSSEQALGLAEEEGDAELLSHALTKVGLWRGQKGDPSGEACLRRALVLHPAGRDPYIAPGTFLAWLLMRRGELDEARALVQEQYRRALETGNEDSRFHLCVVCADLECLAGRWDLARAYAEDGFELSEQSGAPVMQSMLFYARALVHALLGDADAARELVDQGLAISQRHGNVPTTMRLLDVQGFLLASQGRYDDADASFAELRRLRARAGVGAERQYRVIFVDDEIETLIALGRQAEAEALSAELDERSTALGWPPLLALASRARGRILAARTEVSEAIDAVERALLLFEPHPLPFERARTALLLGELLRRAKQKRSARERLEQAVGELEELGARLWAEKARAELARIGGRRASGDALTETERRVAELVAEGKSNKEVAALLFVTVKSVESNLSRIFAKLGVRSRTELAARMHSGSHVPDNL